MLILSRRDGESIMIGEDVVIKILGINGNQVKVGVEAPRGVDVHREEIFLKIKDNFKGKEPTL